MKDEGWKMITAYLDKHDKAGTCLPSRPWAAGGRFIEAACPAIRRRIGERRPWQWPPYPNKKGVLADALFNPPILETRYSSPRPYWQASQVPPLRMASIEHAFFSSAVYSFFSALGAFSTVAFSMLEAPRVRR